MSVSVVADAFTAVCRMLPPAMKYACHNKEDMHSKRHSWKNIHTICLTISVSPAKFRG